ncbi:MAG: divalent-cation tolerance protein CutA [Lautropia sp.]
MTESNRIRIVLTTVAIEADAASLADALVGERLAACVSVSAPMRSVYRWQGAVETATEWQLIAKTTSDALGALVQRLEALHPYDTPEILVLAADGASHAYAAWVAAQTRAEAQAPAASQSAASSAK